jgi:hypothetical protein
MVDEAKAARMRMELERARARTKQQKDPMTLGGAAAATATGLRGAIEGIPGAIGDIPEMAGRAMGWALPTAPGENRADVIERVGELARQTATPLSTIVTALQRAGIIGGDTAETTRSIVAPTSKDVASVTDPAVEAVSPAAQKFTRHVAGNPLEKGMETLGGMLPAAASSGSALQRIARVLFPTAGTEIGGAVGEQLGSETLGRLLGGFGTALTPAATSRFIGGPQLNAERARQLQALEQRGVEVTAGQASGKPALQYAETGPFATKPARIAERQGEQFNRAALREAGIDADRMTPETVQAARDRFGGEYEAVIQRTGGVPLDSDMTRDLVTLVDDYKRLKGTAAAPAVDGYLKRISDAAQANADVIPTDVFRQIRSDIAKDLRKIKDDPSLAQTLRDFQDTLYGSIGRNAPAGVEGTWRDLNNRYRNFKIMEKSMLGQGAGTAEGMITPSKLRGAVQNADPEGYLVERGDLDLLARGGENFMKPLPQSGTAARAALPAFLGGVGTALMSGQPLTAAGLAAGAAATPLASSILTSRPVRTTLINRISGQGPMPLDPLTAALLVRQTETGRQ